MISCPKCNKELSDNAKFCDDCGAQIFETIFCPNCGKKTSAEFAFCQNCDASIADNTHEEQTAETPAEKKKLLKKAILFCGIGVGIAAVLTLLIALFFGSVGKSKNNYALYLKDNEIFFTNLKKDSKAWQLTSRLVDDDFNYENWGGSLYEELLLDTYMSENGKYIFFPDKFSDVSDDYKSISLYYKEVAKPDKDAIKIDSNITSYTVNASATIVTYIKDDERNLYQYRIGEDSKDKIASGVKYYEVSDNAEKICYINSENSIYLKYADKDKDKIASEVSTLEHITKDFTTVYYIKDGSLYKQVEGADKVKIASDVYNVIKIYDSGEIYYLTREAEKISLMNYVNDDMKDADASIIKPDFPDYPSSPNRPSWWYYDTDAEYDEALEAYEIAYEEWETEYNRIKSEYDNALKAYYAKQSRDELREDLEEETLEQSSYSLCFYNGTEALVITDAFVNSNYTYASEAPVISYETCNQSNLEKVKLSEVESVNEIENMVKATLSSSNRYIAVKEITTVVEQEKEANYFIINSSGTIVYYIDNIPNEKNYGELRCIAIKDGVVGKAEVYDSDVYTGYCYFVSDTELEYFKDYKGSKGELYINKNKIDDDVYVRSVNMNYNHFDSNRIFYLTDWNSDKDYGTLKVYNGKEAMKIADDVFGFSVTPDGQVLYLYDYSFNYYKGELYEWSNGKTRKIDDDVVFVIPFINYKYRDKCHGW